MSMMGRVNTESLGISELKWTRMEYLIQMTITSTIVGKNHLEEMELPSQSTEESDIQYLGAFSKATE